MVFDGSFGTSSGDLDSVVVGDEKKVFSKSR
jgi:hypothetical protein